MYNHSCSCVYPPAKCYIQNGWTWEYSWIPSRSFGFKDYLYSNFQHIKTEKHRHFQILYSKQLNSGFRTILSYSKTSTKNQIMKGPRNYIARAETFFCPSHYAYLMNVYLSWTVEKFINHHWLLNWVGFWKTSHDLLYGAEQWQDQFVVVRVMSDHLWKLNSHTVPVLRLSRYFKIVTAQWLAEAAHVGFQINKICICDTIRCSRRIFSCYTLYGSEP